MCEIKQLSSLLVVTMSDREKNVVSLSHKISTTWSFEFKSLR